MYKPCSQLLTSEQAVLTGNRHHLQLSAVVAMKKMYTQRCFMPQKLTLQIERSSAVHVCLIKSDKAGSHTVARHVDLL